MIRDYPEIISKLTLFLGAGMTVKRAWKKIVTDYETAREAKGERYIYEEMAKDRPGDGQRGDGVGELRAVWETLSGSGVYAAGGVCSPRI